MPPNDIASSVANLPRLWQRYASAFNPVKFSVFAVVYLIAYGYGNLSQTVASPLWFPDSVLLCALLLTPLKEWWLYVAVTVPIRFILILHPAVPLWFVLATSAIDIVKATFAAYLLRRLPNGSSHPSTMPQLATFLSVGVFVVPALFSFAGAATRYSLGYGFWDSWHQWFLGDALANVVLTPALLYWSSKYFRVLRPRTAELAVWVVGFALSLMLALSLAHSAYSPIAVCIPVPFLIWAATRFGLIGASTSLSVIALLATARIAEKSALFSMGFESKSVLFLQLFLFVVSIPVLCIATVIEEKNTVEKSLRESEQRLRLAQSAARIGTFEWNIQAGVNTWTSELEEMYGLPPGGFGGTQNAFENLVHLDDRARVIELNDWALKTGQPTTGEWRVVWPDGSVHWIAGRWQAFMDESDEPARMIGVNIDVTDRKIAEQELATAHERLHLAIESGSVGGWDFDLKTGSDIWFGNAHAQLGMAPEETSRSPQEFWDHVHQDDREHLQDAIRAAKDRREEFTEDFRVVWRDGTTHWLRSRGRYHYAANGEPERMLGISLDITQSKQAEQALRESEQRLRLATQAGRMYAYDWDVTANVVVRSSEHVKVLGLTEALSFPQQQFMDKIHPDDRPTFLAAIAELTPENPTREVTYRALASDGTLVWLKSNGRGFFDAEGRLLRVIGMVANVTDLKRAEEALADTTRKLIESQEQERARIGRELHDDINQRLALLAVTLESLKQGLPARAVESRRQIREVSKEVTDIGEEIQALSHRLHSSKLELLGLAGAAAGFCKEVSSKQNVEIVFHSQDVPRELPDEIALTLFRVLQEALQNAIKHSGSKHFRVSLSGSAKRLELTVQDSGNGFDPEVAIKGEGLGLASMRERLRLVGGQLFVESKPQHGTTIGARVGFEAGMKVPMAGMTSGTEKRERIAGLVKVLVVEDYEPFRRFVCSALQGRDAEFDVTQASDGLEAVQKAVTVKPDLILLDIGLPKLHGFEVTNRVGSLVPHAKILFVSQESSLDVIQEAFRVGGQGYVQKSRAQSDLMAAINAVLAGERFVSSGLEVGGTTSTIPRLVLAEDHAAMRETIVKVLQTDFDVVASVETGQAALEAANKLNPDVLVKDVWMLGLDGPDVAKQLKDHGNKTKIVFVSASMDAIKVSSCLAAGGHAYVSKMKMATDLPIAIRKVLVGEGFVSTA